ncbi:hypothetical protein QAD02_005104, partial [Eretmocerus hayati]
VSSRDLMLCEKEEFWCRSLVHASQCNKVNECLMIKYPPTTRNYVDVQPVTGSSIPRTQEVSKMCLRCIYSASRCKPIKYCSESGCGMFCISKEYWTKAGKLTVKSDYNTEQAAFIHCVHNFTCASKTVRSFMKKYSQ